MYFITANYRLFTRWNLLVCYPILTGNLFGKVFVSYCSHYLKGCFSNLFHKTPLLSTHRDLHQLLSCFPSMLVRQAQDWSLLRLRITYWAKQALRWFWSCCLWPLYLRVRSGSNDAVQHFMCRMWWNTLFRYIDRIRRKHCGILTDCLRHLSRVLQPGRNWKADPFGLQNCDCLFWDLYGAILGKIGLWCFATNVPYVMKHLIPYFLVCLWSLRFSLMSWV